VAGKKETIVVEMPDHATAFTQVMQLLERDPDLVPDAIGHRMAHGGPNFKQHVILDDAVMAELERIQELAPIHNPPAVRLVAACRRLYPNLPETVVFDTVFHATIPEVARAYALPPALVAKHGFRKYGFHGTSHQYVAQEAAKLLGVPFENLNAISCHLGSGGASLCAIVNGRSIDNTMGYSPLQGLVMSTRSGDLDPAVALTLLVREGGNSAAVEGLLNRKCGVLGLSGMSADIRDVVARAADGATADIDQLSVAAQVYLWRIRKYLGAYLTLVGGAHCVIFTDTIGEKVPYVRWAVTAGLQCFGLDIDPEKNDAVKALPADLSTPGSRVRILAVATNEEMAIARFSYGLLLHSQSERIAL
jgi:acetate kinase